MPGCMEKFPAKWQITASLCCRGLRSESQRPFRDLLGPAREFCGRSGDFVHQHRGALAAGAVGLHGSHHRRRPAQLAHRRRRRCHLLLPRPATGPRNVHPLPARSRTSATGMHAACMPFSATACHPGRRYQEMKERAWSEAVRMSTICSVVSDSILEPHAALTRIACNS